MRPRERRSAAQAGDLHAAVLAAVEPWDYPVFADLDCGHTEPMATLPIGVGATVQGATCTVDGPACGPVSAARAS